MNEQDDVIVQHMIKYVEDIERDIQAAKISKDGAKKTKAVSEILKELEKQIKNAD